jgi:amicyanin
MPAYTPRAAIPSPATDAERAGAESSVDAGSVVAADTAAVKISGMRYEAPTVTVKKGGVVTWTNNGAMPHTVTANDGSFGSPQLSNGNTWSRTFDEAGTFGYYCSLHPGMRGTVVVVE